MIATPPVLGPEERRQYEEDHRVLEDLRRRRRSLDIEAAVRFARLQRTGTFIFHGDVRLAEYGERTGWCGAEARVLADLGEALEAAPSYAEDLVEGRTCPEKLAAVGKVVRDPTLAKPDEDLRRLLEMTLRDLTDEVKKRLAEKKAGMVFPLKVYLTPKGAGDWSRARVLTVRNAGKVLSGGETLEVVLEVYLDHEDPERKAARAAERGAVAEVPNEEAKASPEGNGRGSPPASPPPAPAKAPRPKRGSGKTVKDGRLVNRTRYTPAAERHALILRDGDRCAIEGCDSRIFLENGHRIPYRKGGPNTAANGKRWCGDHHAVFDSGMWKVVGRPGREVVVDRTGTVIGRLRRPRAPP